MGTYTYECGGGPQYIENTDAERSAAIIALARQLHPDDMGPGAQEDVALALLELEPDGFSMSSERAIYYDEKELSDAGVESVDGCGASVHQLVGRAIAPWVKPGSWAVYMTEGYLWGLVWDGVTCHERSVLPVPPEGVELLPS